VDLDGTGVATLYLLNPTGGVLGGDVLDTEVTLGRGAHVCLTTTSATRVYRSAGPASVQRLAARVGAGAVLEYVPDHLIPSPGARLVQTVAVELGPGALALLLDAWAPGRVVRGEAWRFHRLDLTTTVCDQAGPIFHDRVRLEGPTCAAGAELTEGRPYLATFAALGAGEADWAGLARALGEVIAGSGADLLGGAGPLGRGGVVAKVLARSAPDLRVTTDLLWQRSRAMLLGMPALDLRKL
jgi:urease accessory protein